MAALIRAGFRGAGSAAGVHVTRPKCQLCELTLLGCEDGADVAWW